MAHRVGEAHGTLPNQEVHPMLVPVEEGRDANDHFEDEDSEGPPIHCEVMAIADEHLRGQVLCSAAERVGKFTLLHKLGEAEVSHEEITCTNGVNRDKCEGSSD